MLNRYKLFLKDFDKLLLILFEQQKKYIKCKKGCSKCCQKGDYPFSQLEFAYLTDGYIKLPSNTKILVQQNIRNLLYDKKEYKGERFEHKCPFLINDECCVYEHRGIICRTFGLCYYDDQNQYVRLPECSNYGLNFSKKDLKFEEVPKINLRIDRVFESELGQKYKLEYGEIRPMLEWFGEKI